MTVEFGYDESYYNENFYEATSFREGTELTYGIVTRIVKPFVKPLPIMDMIGRGLAQRFNWINQGIEVFGLFGKLEYASGTYQSNLIMTLDDWGEMYHLPRMTRESDDDYRLRLQTYVSVLNGSGTLPATQRILDILVGMPGVSIVSSAWPAKNIITFSSIEAMRVYKTRQTMIETILPRLFAAGTTYNVLLPFIDYNICSYVNGPRDSYYKAAAAIQMSNELSSKIAASIYYSPAGLDINYAVAICAERILFNRIKSAVRCDRLLNTAQCVAICGDAETDGGILTAIQTMRENNCKYTAAVMGIPLLSYKQRAAVQRIFEKIAGITSFIVMMNSLECSTITAVQGLREQHSGIRVYIARRDWT